MTKVTWAVFWAFMVAVAFAAVAWFAVCYSLVAKDIEKDKIGDLATWVGAIGTISTLIGTIVLATQDRRRAHRDRFTNARLIAAGLQLPIVHAESAMKSALRRLNSFSSQVSVKKVQEEMLEKFNSVPLWNSGDVAPVQFYDPVLAITLIEFMTKFELAKLGVRTQLDSKGYNDDVKSQEFFKNLRVLVVEAIGMIEGKAIQCQGAGSEIYRDPPIERPNI